MDQWLFTFTINTCAMWARKIPKLECLSVSPLFQYYPLIVGHFYCFHWLLSLHFIYLRSICTQLHVGMYCLCLFIYLFTFSIVRCVLLFLVKYIIFNKNENPKQCVLVIYPWLAIERTLSIFLYYL